MEKQKINMNITDLASDFFAHEASIKIIKLAKNVFKLDKIIAITTSDNDSSIKLLKKLGLTYEKKVTPFEDEEDLLLFAKTL